MKHLQEHLNRWLGALKKASRNVKGLLLTVVFDFLWAPLAGWVLARLFLIDPTLAMGFLLVMVVPCSSMSIGCTGLSQGNLELATVAVALSFVLAVVAVPLWMTLFAAGYDVPVPVPVPVPVGDMLKSILTVLIAPMLLGHFTRHLLHRHRHRHLGLLADGGDPGGHGSAAIAAFSRAAR